MLYLLTSGRKTKVGITASERSLKRRIENLQSGNPMKIKLHSLFVENNRELEKKVLQHFSAFKCAGGVEWLNLRPAIIIKYIVSLEE